MNLAKFPQCVADDIKRQIHELSTSVYQIRGHIKGKTLLPFPQQGWQSKKYFFSRSCNEDNEFHLKITGSARIEAEERKVKATKGEDCNMTLKNNIEGIIIKWAYQIDEVLKKSSEEELNTEGSYPGIIIV